MFDTLTKNSQLPAARSPLPPSISSTLWGGFEDLDQMFDRLFHGYDQTLSADGWKAPLAVWEDQEHFYVEVELAGVPQDAVEVTVQDRQLLIAYARNIPEDRQVLYNERPYGCCERRLALPESASAEAIKAEMHGGPLQITLAKAPHAQPRKIAVQAR